MPWSYLWQVVGGKCGKKLWFVFLVCSRDSLSICVIFLIILAAQFTPLGKWVMTRQAGRDWIHWQDIGIVFLPQLSLCSLENPHNTELFRTEVGGEEKNNIYIAIILVRLPECVLCLIQLEKWILLSPSSAAIITTFSTQSS